MHRMFKEFEVREVAEESRLVLHYCIDCYALIGIFLDKNEIWRTHR